MTSIFFIVDGPGLEAQAALLAATLRAHNGDRFRLIAYVPDRHRPHLNPDLVALFAAAGVEIRRLAVAATVWAKPYPHGNKILAATDTRGPGHAMFVDTDMICTAPIDLTGLVHPRAVAMTPEGRPSWGKDLAAWARVYDQFDLTLPQERITLMRGKRRAFVPYFNAGMILFPEGPLAEGQTFGDLWLHTALVIDHIVPVADKRPWLDQISLPVTLKRHGLSYVLAPEALNFSTSRRLPTAQDRPSLMHYHRFGYLADWPQQRALALAQTRALAGDALFARLQATFAPWWQAPPTPAAVAPSARAAA
jgi:hypothetical protein